MNYKIKGLTPELSKQIQKICFDMGITTPVATLNSSIFFISNTLMYTNKVAYFNVSSSEEISPQSFIEKYGKTI